MIVPPGGSTTPLPVAPAIKDLINGIRASSQRQDIKQFGEYVAEALKRNADFNINVSKALQPSPPPPPVSVPVRQKATFWFAQGENQPQDPTLDLNEYDLVFPGDPPLNFTTAIWEYATIYCYNTPVPTMDFLVQLYVDGVAVFTGASLKLPSGTANETIIVATNFANPSTAIVEHSKITGRIVQCDSSIMNVEVVLVFDLVSQ